MRIAIGEYTKDMTHQVVAFNERLRTGGAVDSVFPESFVPPSLPKIAGRRLFQEYYLATDDGGAVRGGYILQPQEFWIGGRTLSIANIQQPISEGIVDRAYAPVGVQLLLDAQRRQPLLFGLGMGGCGEPLPRLMAAAGWEMFGVSFFFRIRRPFCFLRNIAYLRRNALRRCLIDLAACSGLGWLALKTWQATAGRRLIPDAAVSAEIVDEFSDWVDELWLSENHRYGMSAVRDSATLRILYPREEPKFIRLRVRRSDKIIGWAVLLCTQLAGHRQFGNMRLGSLVDCFAAPGDAAKVVRSARAVLEGRGVDLMVSNQSHAAWCAALADCGFLRGPSNFILATSRKLSSLLKESGVGRDEVHVNRGDGDGPINL